MSVITETGRIALSTLGALVLTAGCIGFAVAPARAASPTTTVVVTIAPATGLVGAVRY